MKKHRRRRRRDAVSARTFTAAMLVTMFFAVGAGAVCLALNRMESTMNPEHYTLFSLEKTRGRYALTILNQAYEIDLTGLQKPDSPFSLLRTAAPNGMKAFLLTVSGLVDGLGKLIASD